ncbi:major facilitator superfamily [Heterobasidion irregulare TC 32-1]|uniref:Major facilitator superfamily n=1 Tax=Heterobasidion irregulare (strain TC 32-1) TaxID=747525 RepID=W4KNF6_HETIT|nr:major facilitator superfamily [Heterobasidion irregulare TC 32-1]ETW87358.1 major facilitator superfamily [Heterobasidion irregulare TC 32-1]
MSDEAGDKSKELRVEGEAVPALSSGVFRPDVDTSSIDERKLMRKIDVRLIPWLALLYLLAFLDRGSIGNARLYHIERDLHITDKQYLIALTVFFFPYALFEPASNLALKSLRPSRWLSFIVFIWGVAMTLHGIAHNYGDLIGLRFVLGLAEAGLYPGIVFYLSCWYKRNELSFKIALFFTSATVAGAFSGLLAAAIHKMDGIGGRPGWAWIFILEGLATILAASASFWIIQDFPDTAKFLTDTERVFVVRRLQDDSQFSAGGETFDTKYVWQCLTDWKTYLAMGIHMGFDGPLFAFSLFTPTILNQLGYGTTAANLLSVPVYAWAGIMTCVIGFVGDRLNNKRGYLNLMLFGTGLVGYIILIASRSPSLSYFAVYLTASAIYPTIPNSVAWISGNVEGSYKRSAVLGMAVGFGNLNGAVTSNVYRARDKPWYGLGHGIILAYISIGWLCSLAYMLLLRRENRRRERGERDEVIAGTDNKHGDAVRNGEFQSIEEARRTKGDLWSGFRYTL